MRSFTVEEISEVVKGNLIGSSSISISGAEQIESATENDLTFIGNKSYLEKWKTSKASAALIDEKIAIDIDENRALIKVKNVDLAMAQVLELFIPESPVFEFDIHPSANIHITALISNGCKVGAGCYVGANVKAAENVVLYPNVTIRGRAGVMNNIKDGETILGYSAINYCDA